jgi:hypothetical protein
MLTPITPTTKVVANGTPENPGYNDIRLAILDILAQSPNGYGYTGARSLPVIPGQIISAQQWADLVDDLSVIWVHQNNSSLMLVNNLPRVGNRLTSALGNELVAKVNAVDNVRYRRAPAGQRSVDSTTTSTFVPLPGNTTWGGRQQHTITMNWSSNLTTNYFFNLGGRVTFSVSYPTSAYQDDNLSWKTLIDNYSSDIANLYYDKAKFITGGFITLGSYTRGYNSITITANKINDRSVIFDTKFTNSGVATTLRVTSVISYEYSTGVITAPRPSISSSHTLGDSYVAIIVPTRILTVSQPSTFSLQSGSTSNPQVITLTNNGNTRIDVAGIDFVNDNNLTRITDFTGLGGSTSFSLSPGDSKIFTLAYSGSRLGDYTGLFTVRSNNNSGPVTRQLSQKIVSIPFDFTLSPSAVSVTLESRTIFSQTITIIPSGTYTAFNGYTATVNPPFTINTGFATGPIIYFNPIDLPPGVYSTTVSFIVNGLIKYCPVTINLTAALNQHLGSWTSALSSYNSVLGMSYDIIDGARYLTVGVGQGADGSDRILSSNTTIGVNSLGVNGDSGYTTGPVLYPVQDGAYSPFLNAYGGWPTGDLRSPEGIYISRTYYFYGLPGQYTYQYGVDNQGYFEIDGNLIADLRIDTGSNYRQQTNGTMIIGNSSQADTTLHKLVLYMQNNSGFGNNPGSVGLRIINSAGTEVWTTIYPQRYIGGAPYVKWAEVYRIKINATGISQTVSSGDINLYKSSGAQGFRTFGWAFQNSSIITVNDTLGTGNLEITLNPLDTAKLTSGGYDYQTTIGNLSLAFYYYSTAEYYGRFTQIDSGPVDGNRTRLFVGFNQSGGVLTRTVNLPTSLGTPPSDGGGGGGYYDSGGQGGVD